jgi:hypothetical protein
MKHAHNTDITVQFYNDRILQVISDADIAEPFTYVPIKAGHMELVNGNAIVFGNITEGYGAVPVDVDVELNCEAAPLAAEVQGIPFLIESSIVEEGSDSEGDYVISHLIAYLPETCYETSYTISIDKNNGFPPYVATYIALPGDTNVEISDGLRTKLGIAGINVATCYIPADNKICMEQKKIYYDPTGPFPQYEDPYAEWEFSGHIGGTSSSFYNNKFPQLKRGSKHGFGIVYKDDCARCNPVAKGDSLDVYLPHYSEPIYGGPIGVDFISCDIEDILTLKFKIHSTPPSWATTYEIVYCGNMSMDKWLQMRIEEIAVVSPNRYSVDIQATMDLVRTINERWKVSDWEWEGGDRLRLMGTIDDISGVFTKYTTIYDYEIESVDVDNKFIIQAVNKPALFELQNNIVAEVYRPKKGLGVSGDQEISAYYGSGMMFDVAVDAYGNKYHKGDVDQVLDNDGLSTTPAEVENKAFDSWKFARLNLISGDLSVKKIFWAESYMPSDWLNNQLFVNRITSKGFPFLYDISQKQSILAKRFRWGGYLLSGTEINNIAHFTYADFKDLAEKDGAITGLREVGFTLKAIQWHKETSIYINRIQNFNADGTPDFTLTDAFIGSIRPMETNLGCQHPEGILADSRNLYYWDNIEGKLIRSAPNGQAVISGPEYKMSRWFKDLAKWIIASGGAEKLKVRLGFNVEYNELWVTFRIDDSVYGVIFSESKGRWISKLTQVTDAYVHAGEFFAHLYLQKLWIMNLDEGQHWLTWAGVPTYAELEVVSNIEPGKNKIFNAIVQFADHLLSSLAKYFNIPREASASGELMESNVSVWEQREGAYFGEILKDENTPGNFVNLNDAKMNGQEMRGRYAFAKFKTEEHDEKVRIDSIVILSTPSERNI